MVLFVGKKRLQKSTPGGDQRVAIRELITALDEAYLSGQKQQKRDQAAGGATAAADTGVHPAVITKALREVDEPKILNGATPSCLVVLQAEVGVIQATDANSPVESIASLDATTCLIVALRDPITRRVALTHFDHGGDQAKHGMELLIDLVTGLTAEERNRTAIADAPAAGGAGNASNHLQLEVYMVGAVQFPKFSADTVGSVMVCMAQHPKIDFRVLPEGCCVWSHNLLTTTGKCRHRGLEVVAATGDCFPVESDKGRGYPETRLRGLRCMNAEFLSSISVTPDEWAKPPAWLVAAKKSLLGADSESVGTDAASRPVLPLIVVRPFTWTRFLPDVARKPLDEFLKMSTTPEMEPEDFAMQLKASIVYGHLFRQEEIFKDGPLVFQSIVAPKVAERTFGAQAATAPVEPPVEERQWLRLDYAAKA